MYIPPGFNTITPYFFVNEAERFVELWVNGLDGSEVLRTLRPDGRIANVQVRTDTSTIMASDAFPPTPTACYVYADNATRSVRQAIASGGTLEMEVTDIPYGDRQGGISDPHGSIWWTSQRLIPEPYSA